MRSNTREYTSPNDDPIVAVYRPLLPGADLVATYLRDLDKSRQYANRGELTEKLEQRLNQQVTSQGGNVLLAASGTAAVMAASLAVAGRAIRDRPYCFCPSYTFVAGALAAQLCGYIPYFLDVDPSDWALLPALVASHPELRRCGLVMVAAPYGRPTRFDAWDDFRRRTGVPVVIDAAASIEALMDAPDGSIVDTPLAVSLHATKSLACGEGGLVVSRDRALLRRAYAAMNFGFMEVRETTLPGFNGKMSEYHAAVGLAELDGWSRKRTALRRVADRYRVGAARRGLRLHTTPEIASNYVLWEAPDHGQAEASRHALRRARIGHRFWYGLGVHRQPHFVDCPRDDMPKTDDLAPRLIGLPVAHDLTDDVIDQVLDVIAAG